MTSAGLSRDYAESLDARDELASLRERFLVADPELLYMDGNSLGRLEHASAHRAKETVEREWGESLIGGWNDGWYQAPLRVGDTIGRLVGAAPGQVAATDSTSVNLFKLLLAAIGLRPRRRHILTDTLNFPTDLYVIEGALRLIGGGRKVVRAGSLDDGIAPDLGELEGLLDEEVAVVTLSHAAYKSGYLYDMEAVTKQAHRRGALVVWDLSHSVGVVPIELDAWGVDFAVGCTYKYLNGGPGAPAFLYVRRELQEEALSPIWGWFGGREPFSFALDYAPAPGIARFLAGTPPILSLLTMEAALEAPLAAGVGRLRRKSVELTEYLITLADASLSPLGFTIASPRLAERRGSHITLRHPQGYRIAQGLIHEMKVVPDFRAPDLVRFGCAPLYTRFTEVWDAVDRTRRLVERRLHERYSAEPRGVT